MSVHVQTTTETHDETNEDEDNIPYNRASSHMLSLLEDEFGVTFARVATVRTHDQHGKAYVEDMNGQIRYFLGEDYVVFTQDQMDTEYTAQAGERDSAPYVDTIDVAQDYHQLAQKYNVSQKPQPLTLSDGSEILISHRFVPETSRQ